jgi:Transglutaminase-like superfamily
LREASAVLDFYRRPTTMTSGGKHAKMFHALPEDVAALARVVQGLVVYDVVAASFYGFTVPSERAGEIHARSVAKMLETIALLDDEPLSNPRPVEKRLVGRCHHFALLLVAMLRSKRIPARARSGFGAYFNPPFFEDHWLCEYWNRAEARWVRVDSQIDEVWRSQLGIRLDVLDVPRDQFWTAGDAWQECRAGRADPAKFGIQFGDLRGLWFIAGSLVRDVAALNKVEMLPWDVWGIQPRPGDALADDQLPFFDRLAALSREPDRSFEEVRRLHDTDDRLRVPAVVFNALANREEET